tara:strand:+ start:388 stop:783 length:396 start_codon:yes stop_codon:yes gene_type:complete
MKCLDTTFLIDLLQDDPGAVKKASEMKEEVLFTTSLNVFEFLAGIPDESKYADFELERFRALLQSVQIFPLHVDAAFQSWEVYKDLLKKGVVTNLGDILIAGVVLSNGFSSVVTRDAQHFGRVKGLKVETY